MTCEEAANLINARVDGEISPADDARLESHLADCAECRAELENVLAQNTRLHTGFASLNDGAQRVERQVISQLPERRRQTWRAPWWSPIAAAAAGFLVAWALFHNRQTSPPVVAVHSATAPSANVVAHLTLATGAVECRTSDKEDWSALPTGGAVVADAQLRTGPGVRCEFRTTDGSELRLDENTQLALASPRRFNLASGQAWSSVAHQAADHPFEAIAAAVTFTALGTQFDLQANADEATLTVVEGSVRVTSSDRNVIVPSGRELTCPSGHLGDPQPVQNLALATRWVNEILVLKGRDDPELNRRVDDLFAQIGDSKMSYMLEDEVRALGDHCVIPLTRYIESSRSAGKEPKRVAAAKIVADVAPPWAIPELLQLLNDENGDVRAWAATALQRLTGQTLGRSPQQWKADSLYTCTPSVNAWSDWWQRNKQRYPGVSPTQSAVIAKKQVPLPKG